MLILAASRVPAGRRSGVALPGGRPGCPLCRQTRGMVRPIARNGGITYRLTQIAQNGSYPIWGSYFEISDLPAEEEFGGRAHHVGAPHRVEGQLGVHGLDAFYGEGLRLDLFLDQVPNRTHRAG